jgi:pyruvate kinase
MSAIENYKKPNSLRVEEFEVLGEKLNEIYINTIGRAQKAQGKFLFTVKENENKNEKICSLDNLLCYLALREQDLLGLQLKLAEEGLSSLGMSESHVLVSIEQVLKHFGIKPVNTSSLCKINSQSGMLLLTRRSELLFGSVGKGRRTYIMVTLDSSDIYQHELIEQLLENGMDIARINCAHNTAREWKLLVETIRSAEERLVQRGKGIEGRKCTILMDLAGPKIRTGPMEVKVRPLQISSPKDLHGRPVRFIEGFLDSEASETEVLNLEGAPSSFVIAISRTNYGGLGSLKVGQKITFKDARDERPRNITVLERTGPTRVRIGLEHTAFLNEGIKLECQINDADNDSKCSFTVGAIKAQPIEINVEAGNILRLYRDNTSLGHNADSSSPDGKPAGISCTHPRILNQVKVGHRVFIDDGKIEAIVRSSNEEYLELEIISPKGMTAKIKSNKGINFPDSPVRMPALTPVDIKNLDFIVKYADMVGLSFVHGSQDVYDLHKALSKLDHSDLGVVAKIETSDSIHDLANILIAGLDLPKFAVLIARGDLAVEVGFENLAFIQDDILCLCEAAHIPVILATQILESLAESGLRSRAEIADAIVGQRAECVMLNNGPHILEAVQTLARLLSTKKRYQLPKKHQLFREFTKQYDVFD